jgi:hypothetical protein
LVAQRATPIAYTGNIWPAGRHLSITIGRYSETPLRSAIHFEHIFNSDQIDDIDDTDDKNDEIESK